MRKHIRQANRGGGALLAVLIGACLGCIADVWPTPARAEKIPHSQAFQPYPKPARMPGTQPEPDPVMLREQIHSVTNNAMTEQGLPLIRVANETHSGALQNSENPTAQTVIKSAMRFVKLNPHGHPLPIQSAPYAAAPWACVWDRQHQRVWEVKRQQAGMQHQRRRFVWDKPGESSRPSPLSAAGACATAPCDVQTYIKRLNQQALCGSSQWRLPRREELRSLVNYAQAYPGPTINQQLFPNTVPEFYWSSDTDSADPLSAWGIGFSFGYDYSYLKVAHGHVRLLHIRKPLAQPGSESKAQHMAPIVATAGFKAGTTALPYHGQTTLSTQVPAAGRAEQSPTQSRVQQY